MRTSAIRAFTRRELRGLLERIDARPGVLALECVERIAALVATRTDDADTIAAVYVYGLVRYGQWNRERLAAAGIPARPRLAGEAARAHPSRNHRFPTSAVTRAELIRACEREIHPRPDTPPPTARQRADERVRTDKHRLARADRDTVRRLIADLDSAEEEAWWYAVGALIHARSAEAVEPLLAAWERLYRAGDLENTRWERLALVRAVRVSMTEAHLPLALRWVEHEDEDVSALAARLLRRADDPAARAAAVRHELRSLRPLLGLTTEDPTPTRPDEVMNQLVQILTDDPRQDRVVRAMERLGDESCLPALTKTLGSRPAGRTQTEAGQAIRAIGGKPALGAAVLEVLADPAANGKRAIYLAGRLQLTEAVPDLLAVLRERRPGVVAAASSLAALGATSAGPLIAQTLARTGAEHRSARRSLLQSLCQFDPEPAVDELLAVLGGDERVRVLAMNALARCRGPRAVLVVTTALVHGVIRMDLVRPLAERGEPGLVHVLIHVVNTTPDPKVRKVATRGILQAAQADQEAVDEQLKFLHHSAAARTALAWLEGRRAAPRASHRLHELMQAARSQHEQVRAQAVKSLALVGTPGAFEVIRGLSCDRSRHVRACVAGALRAVEAEAA